MTRLLLQGLAVRLICEFLMLHTAAAAAFAHQQNTDDMTAISGESTGVHEHKRVTCAHSHALKQPRVLAFSTYASIAKH